MEETRTYCGAHRCRRTQNRVSNGPASGVTHVSACISSVLLVATSTRLISAPLHVDAGQSPSLEHPAPILAPPAQMRLNMKV
jgi:hypothetical protein